MTFKTEIGITEEKTAKIHVYLHFRCNLSYFFNKKNFTCYYDVFDMIQYICLDQYAKDIIINHEIIF